MLDHALVTAGGIAFANAVLFPLDRRYKAWKSSRPEIILKRNWRGQLVPDLTVKRLERAAAFALAGLVVLGLAIGWTIMTTKA